tara:strand:+ start:11910 stop:12497 length:588 start_codon:yes stop_codon:yes gene_type:complete
MAIGVILDVKLYNLAPAKESLLNAVGNIPVGEDLFYLYHPEAIYPLEKKGEKIQCIHYYSKVKINVNTALTQSTYVLGSERDEEYRRKIILITDNYDTSYNEQLNVLFKINEAQRFDCEYFFIGIGQQDFEFDAGMKTIVDSPQEIQNVLDKIFSEEKHGERKDEANDGRGSDQHRESGQSTLQPGHTEGFEPED